MAFSIWYLFLQLVPVVIFLYFYIQKKYSFWSSRGINGPRPIFPFGYLFNRAINEPPEFEYKLSQKYGRLYGVYSGLLPTLVVNDADLIKNILIKDFPKFFNRRSLNSYHPLWNDNMFNAEAESWKRTRTITSPAFTSTSLRRMYPLMNRCVEKFSSYLYQMTSTTGEVEIDTKKVIMGFTIDVIASTSFATNTDANGDRSKADSDPLLKHSQVIMAFNGFKIASIYALPRPVLNLLGITSWFDDRSFNYFIDLTRTILRQRKAEEGGKVKRNDFVQMLLDCSATDEDLEDKDYEKLTATATDTPDESANEKLSKPVSSTTRKHTLSENDIIAQSILFFAAGFETTAATITHCLYELAKNPVVQEKLFTELDQNLDAFPSDESVESADYFDIVVNQSPYLDSVIKETLRRYPAAIRLERRITAEKGYKIAGMQLEKGTLIEMVMFAVHHDAEYFPEPFAFKPERFMPENKHLIKPYTYIPFGHGPRNCIGMRFSLQEIKLLLAKIIRQYRFSPTPQTPEKLSFKPGSILLNVKPFPLNVSRR